MKVEAILKAKLIQAGVLTMMLRARSWGLNHSFIFEVLPRT